MNRSNTRYNDLVIQATVAALRKALPFVVYRLPGENEFVFYADDDSDGSSTESFAITKWGDTQPCAAIRNRLSATDIIKMADSLRDQSLPAPWGRSTTEREYIEGVNEVVRLMRQSEGKTVISRVEATIDPALTVERIVDDAFDMFERYPAAVCCIYNTPQTGAWVVASPEPLIDVDLASGLFSTVALAGTRPSTERDKEWDMKNIGEHSFVVRQILESARTVGAVAEAGERESVFSGELMHLMTPISGHLNGVSPKCLIAAIHPSAAISGYPVADALAIINRVERHPRECYGGYVTINRPDRLIARVNLRCFNFADGIICRYGGGGIVAASSPAAEWRESSLKIAATKPQK